MKHSQLLKVLFAFVVLHMCICSNAKAQVIPYFEGWLDCDTAYTNLELGLCSKYLLDSATAEMDALVTQLQLHIDSELVEVNDELPNRTDTDMLRYLREENERLHTLRNEVAASQAAFLVYASHGRQVVGEMVGMGRERGIHENYAQLDMVIARIETLQHWLDFR